MSTKILALGVHNDDCEYSVGGTAKLLADRGCEVYFSELTSPYHCLRDESQQNDSCLTLGIQKKLSRHIETPNAILHNYDTIAAYEDMIREVQPDIAFIMWPKDNHIEHENCAKAQIDALFRVGGVQEVYAYEVGPLQSMAFLGVPDLTIDITDSMDAVKETILHFFASARSGEALWQEKEVSARWRGHMAYAGFFYAEVFKIIKFPDDGRDLLLRQILEDKFRWGGIGSYYHGRQNYF